MSDYHTQQLNKHLYQLDAESARQDAIDEKSSEINITLLSLDKYKDISHVNDSKGNAITIESFISDVEIDASDFMDFLNENMTYGTGRHFRGKMLEKFEVFCDELATELIDSQEPEQDYDTREEYEGDC